jgi:hypothetical protein
MKEERETLKTKGGTIYKGGKYGSEYSDDEQDEKKKVSGQGRGRPKKETPPVYSKSNDPFGRVPDTAPKGEKGTRIKGKGTEDTVDESAPKGWEGTVKAMKKHKEIDNPYALTNYMKNKGMKSHVKESKMGVSKALMESVNFRKMVDEANMTVDEMLECINGDIQTYKTTGDMTDRLRDFMHLHNHMKSLDEELAKSPSFAPQRPSGQDILPAQKPGIVGKAVNALKGPGDEELMARLQQDVQPQRTVDEELNELAKLAGITDENDGMGPMEEDETGPIQMYQESKKTNLEDIARLSGIFQEGRDYGDTTFNEPPVYDNTPDEQVQGEDVLLKGGDGEIAGQEKKMNKDGAARFSDNPLAMKEDKELLKPAAEFNYVKEMGRDLMKAYQGIKTK